MAHHFPRQWAHWTFFLVVKESHFNKIIHLTAILITNDSLMKDERIAEYSPWSILQYFLTSIKQYLVFFFEWPLKTGFTV